MVLLATPVAIDDPDLFDDAIERAAQAADQGADLIEWRVDMLVSDPDHHATVARLVAESPLPCILTCRIDAQGGGFDGPEFERIALLQHLLDADTLPRYIDLEHVRLAAEHDLRSVVERCRSRGTSVIASTHDFTGRPNDLIRQVADMGMDDLVDVVKVAYQASALRDALQCADLLAARPKPMIALAMGQAGVLSRVMAGAWGGLLTFAALDAGSASAPGQPTLTQMIGQWRIRSITDKTAVYGLVGWPLGASPGFARHNDTFTEQGDDAVYLPLPIREGWERFKADMLELIGHPLVRFGGASVTMPHKAHCLQLVRDGGGTVDAAAAMAGVANTITVDGQGGLAGANTDVVGVRAPLDALGARCNGGRAAVLGAGGAARAACVALLQAGASVRVFNRSAESARALVDDLKPHGDVAVGDSAVSASFNVVVQCTPVGMAHGPAPDGDAMDATGFNTACIADDAVALETIYDPPETSFVTCMKTRGVPVAGGLDMWMAQAAGQHTCWSAAQW